MDLGKIENSLNQCVICVGTYEARIIINFFQSITAKANKV